MVECLKGCEQREGRGKESGEVVNRAGGSCRVNEGGGGFLGGAYVHTPLREWGGGYGIAVATV